MRHAMIWGVVALCTAACAVARAGEQGMGPSGAGAEPVARVARSAGCEVTTRPAGFTVGPDGYSGSLQVFASGDCRWVARERAPWLATRRREARGTGDGVVRFTVKPLRRARSRTAVLRVGGVTVPIIQLPAMDSPAPFRITALNFEPMVIRNAPPLPMEVSWVGTATPPMAICTRVTECPAGWTCHDGCLHGFDVAQPLVAPEFWRCWGPRQLPRPVYSQYDVYLRDGSGAETPPFSVRWACRG